MFKPEGGRQPSWWDSGMMSGSHEVRANRSHMSSNTGTEGNASQQEGAGIRCLMRAHPVVPKPRHVMPRLVWGGAGCCMCGKSGKAGNADVHQIHIHVNGAVVIRTGTGAVYVKGRP